MKRMKMTGIGRKFKIKEFSTDEVGTALKEMRSDSNPGFISIEAIVFKESSNEVNHVFCSLFNNCLRNNCLMIGKSHIQHRFMLA